MNLEHCIPFDGPSSLEFRPVLGPWSMIALAQDLHDKYIKRLNTWYEWLKFPLSGTQTNNAQGVMLLNVITDAMIRRSTGVWQTRTDLPTADEMEAALDEKRINEFRCEIIRQRWAIENDAQALINIVKNDKFIDEFDGVTATGTSIAKRDWQIQLQILAELTEGLTLSWTGRRFIIDSLRAPTPKKNERVPILHRARVRELKITFIGSTSEHVTSQRLKAADAAIQFQENLLPVLTSLEMAEFAGIITEWLEKWHTVPLPPMSGTDPSAVRALLNWAQRWQEGNLHLWKVMERTLIRYQFFIATLQLKNADRELSANPTLRNKAEWMSAIGEYVGTLTDALVKLNKLSASTTLKRLGGSASVLAGVYDSFGYASDMWDAWFRQHYLDAAGKGLAVISGLSGILAGVAICAGWEIAVPIGIASTILELSGITISLWAESGKMREWFESNYFGGKWAGVPVMDTPERLTYRWKEPDGTPQVEFQISEFASLIWPLLSPEASHFKGSVDPLDGILKVLVEIKPKFADPKILVTVYSIWHNHRIKVYEAALDDTVVPATYSSKAALPQLELNQEEEPNWSVILFFSPYTPPASIEVILTMPTALLSFVQGGAPAFEPAENLPLAIRVRRPVQVI